MLLIYKSIKQDYNLEKTILSDAALKKQIVIILISNMELKKHFATPLADVPELKYHFEIILTHIAELFLKVATR